MNKIIESEEQNDNYLQETYISKQNDQQANLQNNLNKNKLYLDKELLKIKNQHDEKFKEQVKKTNEFFNRVNEIFTQQQEKIRNNNSTAFNYLGSNSALKQILMKGLTQMNKLKPDNPLQFMGKFLIENS